MFFKNSRYYKLLDIVTTDGRERRVKSKAFRPAAEVGGVFRHTLEEPDRLDHLAYKYYRKPRKWWRICDANPEFMSPLALLGQEPLITEHFPVSTEKPVAPWPALLRALRETVGVESAKLGTDQQPHPTVEIRDEARLLTLNLELTAQLDAAVRQQQIPVALSLALQDAGLTLGPEVRASKIDSERWRIQDLQSAELITFWLRPEGVGVYRGVTRHSWILMLVYNEQNMTSRQIADRIAAEDFTAGRPQRIGRIGKPIVIPPDTAG